MRSLLPHQKQVLYGPGGVAGQSAIALFMEMRLGKTLVTIRWARAARPRRILVVAPLSVLAGWVDELHAEDIPACRIHTIRGTLKERLAAADRYDYYADDFKKNAPSWPDNWYLVGYESLRATPQLTAYPWDIIVLDESTRIRNPKAQITKLVTNRYAGVNRRAILSGMPAPEGPLDYFCQMRFLFGSFMGTSNYWAFREKYFHSDERGWDWTPNRGTLDEVKQAVHRSAVVMTRREAGLGNRKIYERREIEMSPEQKAAHRSILKNFEYDGLTTQWVVKQQTWLARVAGGFSPDQERPRLLGDGKIKEVVTLLKEELRHEQVVIWFRFNEELRAVEQALERLRVPLAVIVGATPVDTRKAYQQLFRRKRIRVLLMQEKVGQFGLDLSAASTAIYYSNWWDYEVRAQTEDRIEHPTKHEPLLYIDLVTRGSVDPSVVDTLRDKRLTARQFMMKLAERLADQWRSHEIEGSNPQGRARLGAAATATLTLRAKVRRI